MAKILLIEDDRTMLGLLKTLLEIEGFQVSTIGDGHGIDPLQTIRQEQPDAILLDVHLRFMDGLNLLREIRADGELHDLHVIMSSGENLQEECLRGGANSFLLKPYMPEELINLLHAIHSDR